MLLALERAQAWCPAPLRVLPVVPGRTLALLYLARYGQGSTLCYHELIVACALARSPAAGGHPAASGFWISHIYVDDVRSQAGGRAIWGLPKALARFEWDAARSEWEAPSRDSADPVSHTVRVFQGEQLLCALECGSAHTPGPLRLLSGLLGAAPVPLLLPALSAVEGEIRRFWASGQARLSRVSGQLTVPAASPFSTLVPSRGAAVWRLAALEMRVRGVARRPWPSVRF